DAAQSPDGLPNYWIRSTPGIVAGQNSQNALGSAQVSGITRGSNSVAFMDPHQPTSRAQQWNFTLERELMANTVLKTGFVGTHGARMGQFYQLNDTTPAYVWYVSTGLPLPTGEYANVATRPLDQTVIGGIKQFQKTGWSNDVSYRVELEHRFSKGFAFQWFYVMSNAMRVAGDGWRDDPLLALNQFVPGSVPTDDAKRDRLEYYRRDPTIPKHRVNWNFLVDLPVGRGKGLGRNSGKLLNAFIGGWQLAGSGRFTSRYFALPAGNWNNFTPVQVYGKKYAVDDCTSGVCYNAYLYWNGYINPQQINAHNAAGQCTGVCGVPDSYVPYATPLIPIPKNPIPGDPNAPNYGTNNIFVTLKDGSQVRTTYAPG